MLIDYHFDLSLNELSNENSHWRLLNYLTNYRSCDQIVNIASLLLLWWLAQVIDLHSSGASPSNSPHLIRHILAFAPKFLFTHLIDDESCANDYKVYRESLLLIYSLSSLSQWELVHSSRSNKLEQNKKLKLFFSNYNFDVERWLMSLALVIVNMMRKKRQSVTIIISFSDTS